MRKSRKWTAILTALTLGVTLLAGCGGTKTAGNGSTGSGSTEQGAESTQTAAGEEGSGTESAGPDISQEVELTMYCIGDEGGIYADEVLDNLNVILKEKINATLKPVMVSWGEYREKLPLIYASGESYDLAYAASWCNYAEEALKGPFLELSDLMQEYAPKTYAELHESGALDAAKVNGSLYMFPSTYEDYPEHFILWREDLRKKYDLPEITDWDSLAAYMDGILANEPGMTPMALHNTPLLSYFLYNDNDWNRPIVGGDAFGVLTYDITEGKDLINIVETPEYEAFVKRNREWYQKGYWSRNVLSETTDIKDSFLAGRSAIAISNYSESQDLYKSVRESNPDWELDLENLSGGVLGRVTPTSNGTVIGINSKHPERAMMFLELMNQDEETFRAMFYGIEDKTYVVTEDGRKTIPEGVDPTTLSLRNLGMGMQVDKFILPDAEADQKVLDKIEGYESNATYPVLSSFVIDDTPIAAEIAAVNNVVTEYKIPLDLGVADPETALPELKKKLEEAGLQKVLEEVQRQIDAYNAQNQQ